MGLADECCLLTRLTTLPTPLRRTTSDEVCEMAGQRCDPLILLTWQFWRRKAVASARASRRALRVVRSARLRKVLLIWREVHSEQEPPTPREEEFSQDAQNFVQEAHNFRLHKSSHFVHLRMQRLKAAGAFQNHLTQHIRQWLQKLLQRWSHTRALSVLARRIFNRWYKHAQRQVLWAFWSNVETWKQKNRMVNSVQALKAQCVLQSCFIMLRQWLVIQQATASNKKLAESLWIMRCLRRVVTSWRCQTNAGIRLRDITWAVAQAANARRVRCTYKALLYYVQMHKQHRELGQAIVDLHLRNLCSSILRGFCSWALTRAAAHKVVEAHETCTMQTTLQRWIVTTRSFQRFRTLSAARASICIYLVSLWRHDLDLVACLTRWYSHALMAKRHRIFEQRQALRAQRLQRQIICAWLKFLYFLREQVVHHIAQSLMRTYLAAMQLWRARVCTQLSARSLISRRCRLTQRSWYMIWRVVVRCIVDCKALMVSYFLAWAKRTATCSSIRLAMRQHSLKSRAMETFQAAQWLRQMVQLFSLWKQHVSDALQRRSSAAASLKVCLQQPLRAAFKALRFYPVLKGLSRLDATLCSRDCRRGLRFWRRNGWSMAVAARQRDAYIKYGFDGFRLWVVQRRHCASLVSCLSNHMRRWTLAELNRRAQKLAAAEFRAVAWNLRRTECAAFASWRAYHWHVQVVAVVPPILRAWKHLVRIARILWRRYAEEGLATWKTFVKRRWAFRRRCALADALHSRRLMLRTMLQWQLWRFSESSCPEQAFLKWQEEQESCPGPLRPLSINLIAANRLSKIV